MLLRRAFSLASSLTWGSVDAAAGGPVGLVEPGGPWSQATLLGCCWLLDDCGCVVVAGLPVERDLRRRPERDLERLSEGERELLRESRDLDLDLLACAWCRSPPPSPVFGSGGKEIDRSLEIERLPQPLC